MRQLRKQIVITVESHILSLTNDPALAGVFVCGAWLIVVGLLVLGDIWGTNSPHVPQNKPKGAETKNPKPQEYQGFSDLSRFKRKA